jgi:hypothetical protein
MLLIVKEFWVIFLIDPAKGFQESYLEMHKTAAHLDAL